jgi:H+-transporting ATPase
MDAVDIVPGDVLIVRLGDIVPADIKILGEEEEHEEEAAPMQVNGARGHAGQQQPLSNRAHSAGVILTLGCRLMLAWCSAYMLTLLLVAAVLLLLLPSPGCRLTRLR